MGPALRVIAARDSGSARNGALPADAAASPDALTAMATLTGGGLARSRTIGD
jgi:hypothetical protein